jgi:hypothetical protein
MTMQEKSSRSSVARTEGSRNPGKGVMHLIARHHGEIARVRRLARARAQGGSRPSHFCRWSRS